MTIIETLFGWVCIASLRSSVLVLLVLLARQLWHSKLNAKWNYALWFPVLIALMVPALPVLPSGFLPPFRLLASDTIGQRSRAFNTISDSAVDGVNENRSEMPGHDGVLGEHRSSSLVNTREAGDGGRESRTEVQFWRSWIERRWSNGFSILAMIWIGGAVSSIAFTIVSYHFALSRIMGLAQNVDEHLLARITTVNAAVGLRRMPKVLNSAAVQSPAVCGLFRPTLLLNARQLRQLTDGELDMVLTHELTHIQRGDLYLNGIFCLLLAMHWFNPILWIAFFYVRNDREAVCDDDVLRGKEPAQRVVYGNALLKLEADFNSRLSLPLVGMMQNRSQLKKRIHFIAQDKKIGGFMKAILILFVCLLTLVGIAKAGDLPQQPQGNADSGEAVINAQNAGKAKSEVSQQQEKTETNPSATGSSGASDQEDSTLGWGPLAEYSGLRSRLTMESESPTVGKPLRFRLEVKNFGDRVTEINPQTYTPFRVLRADFADERPGGAPFIGATVQTSASPVPLMPGESLLLWEQVDLNDFFLLKDEDTYDVYAEGGEWAMQTTWRDSNRIRVTLASGPLQPEQQLLAQLLPIMPKGWRLSRSFGDITFICTPSNLKEDALSVQLLFRDEAMVQQMEKQLSSKTTSVIRMGTSRWGEGILVISTNKVTPHWPNCVGAISSVLQQFSSSSQ
jgi:beta-lactamase regulating signal transducer with metallopeptidase domain